MTTKKISELKNWEKNPRSIKTKDFDRLKIQIKKLGQYKPLLITADGIVLGGNMRLRAYKELGIENIWVSVVDAPTEEKKLEYALSDNDRAGYYEDQNLAEMLTGMPGFPLDEYQIDLGKMTSLTSLLDMFRPVAEEDEIPDNPATVAQIGDVWALGRHRVMCGDSTSPEAVARLMCGKQADMVMSDPPYNVEYTGGSTNEKDRGDSYKDKWTDEQYIEFLRQIYQNANDISKGEAAFMIWFASAKMRQIMDGFEKAGWVARTLIVWNKLKAHYGALGAQYKHRMEPLWYCHKKGKSPKWYGATNECTVWDCDQPRVNDLHPTMKPVELYVRCIKNHTKEDDIVYETFLGSGTTLIAAEKTGRICYGMEIDPHYCDVIIARWEKLTNLKAEKITE